MKICWEIYWIESKINKRHIPKTGTLNCLDWDFFRARTVWVYFWYCWGLEFDLFHVSDDFVYWYSISYAYLLNRIKYLVLFSNFREIASKKKVSITRNVDPWRYLQSCRCFERTPMRWIRSFLIYIEFLQSCRILFI